MKTRHAPDRTLDDADAIATVADFVYDAVFRATLDRPGYAHLAFAPEVHSHDLRRAMLTLSRELSARHGEPLGVQWMLRFDQQTTGRFHRDNGADESYLLLAYEPSSVESHVYIADFARAAHDFGITPEEFEARFNPLLAENADRLAPYTTRLAAFDPAQSNLLVINNSVSRPGVFHQATVREPIRGARRVINSVQLAPLSLAPEKITPEDKEAFVSTDTF